MSKFEVLKRQPNFPNEDLDDANVPIMEFFLQDHPEAEAQTNHLRDHLRPLHATAYYALQLCDVDVVDYTPSEYEAFCKEFASFEYVSLMVNPRQISGQLIINHAHRLLTGPTALPEIDLAEGRQAWIEAYPNVNDVLVATGSKEGDSLPELYYRSMGAQIACELQRSA